MAKIGRSALWIGGAAMIALSALPVVGQESLLPPGFDSPPGDRPARPAPPPKARPETRPETSPADPAAPNAPTTASPTDGAPRAAAPATTINSGTTQLAGTDAEADAPRLPQVRGVTAAGQEVTGILIAAATADGPLRIQLADGSLVEVDSVRALASASPRYDLPPGSRRLLTRIGPLSEARGSLAPGAFGTRGLYLTAIMDKLKLPLASRWGSILLRRAMLSGVDTPLSVNGADFAAARARVLLRQGEVAAARMLVQSVDLDKASVALKTTALDVFIASGDPAGLCPMVPGMAGGREPRWQLAQAMCAGLNGEPSTANALLSRARRGGQAAAVDIKLAEKVAAAGPNSRRSARVAWDDVDTLSPWSFGLATATAVPVPASLWRTATPAMRDWAVQSPMIPVFDRLAFAPNAAARGVLSARGYVSLVSLAASLDEPPATTADLAEQVREAFAGGTFAARITAIAALGEPGYGGKVLAARAAARIAPVAASGASVDRLIEAMFAGGLDRNASAWAPFAAVGSQGWALLAVGAPQVPGGLRAGQVDDYAGDDGSSDQLRTRFLAAALIGLDRVPADDAATLAEDYPLDLGRSTRWTRGIAKAAERGEAATVALLAAAGLQTGSWADVPPYHLYHIVRALKAVGLEAEARMIAAEALTRA